MLVNVRTLTTLSLVSPGSCELIWDPSEAARKGIVLEEGKDVVSGVKHNLREQALVGLSSVDYNVEVFESSVAAGLQPWDGSDWTQEQRDLFHSEIFRTRRDVSAVAKRMNLPVKICHAYYLGIYKNSNEYRLLKTVGKEEREIKEEEQGMIFHCSFLLAGELVADAPFLMFGIFRHVLCVWRRRKIDYLRRL